jgi:hypothetical protein
VNGRIRTVLAGVVVLAAMAAIGVGLSIVGRPSEARRIRLDDRRIQDLQKISTSVDVYWTREKSLPVSLDLSGLSASVGVTEWPVDPVTGEQYGYRVIDAATYELCATFAAKSDRHGWFHESFWAHDAGRQCFRVTPKEIKR